MMSAEETNKEFSVEEFRVQIYDWAAKKGVKYVPDDVFHLLLLKEADVRKTLEEKGIDAGKIIEILEKQVNLKVANGGKEWVGNEHDIKSHVPVKVRGTNRDILEKMLKR